MKIEQLIVDQLNKMDFCIKYKIVFYDYFKANNLPYPKGSQTLSLVTPKIFKNRELRFFAHLTEKECFFDLVISDNFHLPFKLLDYFEKSMPSFKSKLVINRNNENFETLLIAFFNFLNQILYSPEIHKLITTDYWTEEYYVDMWGNYK
jgi:hypothetical protein